MAIGMWSMGLSRLYGRAHPRLEPTGLCGLVSDPPTHLHRLQSTVKLIVELTERRLDLRSLRANEFLQCGQQTIVYEAVERFLRFPHLEDIETILGPRCEVMNQAVRQFVFVHTQLPVERLV